MFTPETAYQIALVLVSGVNGKPKILACFDWHKNSIEIFSTDLKFANDFIKKLPVIAGESAGIVSTGPIRLASEACLFEVIMVAFGVCSQNLPASTLTVLFGFRRVGAGYHIKLRNFLALKIASATQSISGLPKSGKRGFSAGKPMRSLCHQP